jgi:hypothetical protein
MPIRRHRVNRSAYPTGLRRKAEVRSLQLPSLKSSRRHGGHRLVQWWVIAYYEEVLVGALRLAKADAEQGRDNVWLQNIFKTVSDLSEDLAEHGDSDAAPAVNAKGRTSANHKVVS